MEHADLCHVHMHGTHLGSAVHDGSHSGHGRESIEPWTSVHSAQTSVYTALTCIYLSPGQVFTEPGQVLIKILERC